MYIYEATLNLRQADRQREIAHNENGDFLPKIIIRHRHQREEGIEIRHNLAKWAGYTQDVCEPDRSRVGWDEPLDKLLSALEGFGFCINSLIKNIDTGWL